MQNSKKKNKHSYNKTAKVLKLNKMRKKKKKVTFEPNLMKKLKLTVSESGSSGAIIGGTIFGVVFVSIVVVAIILIKKGGINFGRRLGRGLGRGRRR